MDDWHLQQAAEVLAKMGVMTTPSGLSYGRADLGPALALTYLMTKFIRQPETLPVFRQWLAQKGSLAQALPDQLAVFAEIAEDMARKQTDGYIEMDRQLRGLCRRGKSVTIGSRLSASYLALCGDRLHGRDLGKRADALR